MITVGLVAIAAVCLLAVVTWLRLVERYIGWCERRWPA